MDNLAARIAGLSPEKCALLTKRLQQRADPCPSRITRRPDCAPVPMSFAQERLWFLDQMEPGSAWYNIPVALRLTGRLDMAAFRQAIHEIVQRHEVLRTTFSTLEGQPVQVIAPALTLEIPTLDLVRCPKEVREAEARRLALEEAQRPFNLGRGPLIRVSLLDLGAHSDTGESERVVLFTLHHIIVDGWSMDILVQEFIALYEAFSKGKGSPLPGLPIQYADYAVWQRGWLQGEVLERQLAYWKRRLDGSPTGLELPTDRPRPVVRSHRGATYRFMVSRAITEQLKALGQREGATLFIVLLAAFKVLLSRYTGERDMCVGTALTNRRWVELEGLIGFFVNTVVVRTNLSGNPSFTELLKRVREVFLGAQVYQDLPFEKLVEELQPERSLSYSPLFQVMFVLQNASESMLEIQRVRITLLEVDTLSAKFDLTLSITERENGLDASFEYSTDLFDEPNIARLAGHYRVLIESILAKPDAPLSDLEFLPEPERHQLLVDWNATEVDYPGGKCLHQLFEAQVEKTPEAVAVVYEDQALTYSELNARANQLAHYLRGLEVGPEVLVGICVERSLEMVVGLLGILKAGGAYLPLDPGYPRERLAYMLEDAAPRVLLTQVALLDLLPEDPQGFCLDRDWSLVERWSSKNPTSLGTPQNLAYVTYTSGSTGKPKGVGVSHQNVGRLLAATETEYRFDASDIWTLFHSYAFDFSVWELWGALLYGGRVVVVPYWVSRSPEAFHQLLRIEHVTVLNQTPSSFYQLDDIDAALNNPAGLSLRFVIFGGEALEPRRLRGWFARHGDVCPRLVNMYGITETTVHVTARALGLSDTEDLVNSGIGRPLPDLQAYLFDAQGSLVPVGVPGELYVGGAGLARGYLNRPGLTAERFIPNHYGEAGSRLYRTGDLARYRPDGNIEYLGRIDHQVKVRGFRIELGEIEARLLEHAGVREAIVLAREDSPGDKRLVAYLVAQDEQPSLDTLRTHLQGVLPDYMVPAAFVFLEALPLTPNGKVDRKALPAPDLEGQLAHQYVAPRNATEEILAGIWAEVLGIERVGIHDNFFELGGHSLLAVTVIERLRPVGCALDVRALFTTPTVAGLADRMGREQVIDVPPNRIAPDCAAITPELLPLVTLTQLEIDRIVAQVPGGVRNIQDIYPLAPLQEGMLFHHLLETKGDVYVLPTLLGFDTRARLDGFLQALRAVIARHDILRTAVVWEGLPEAVQVVWRDAPLQIEEVQLKNSEDAAAELRARFDPRHYRLDVRQAPLLRGFMAEEIPGGRWLLLLLSHHLALDHTTLELLVGEVQAHVLGRSAELPVPLPFRNFVAQARLGVSRAEHEAYFHELLGDVDEPSAPFGLLDVQGDGSAIEEGRIELDGGLARRVRRCARQLGVSAASLCHLAWALVLGRVSSREDVVFGTVLLGRTQGGEGADRVLGMFINTLPVRIRLGNEGVMAAVRRTHALLADLLRHEHASLVLAQRCSGVAAPTPLFSALFNYRYSAEDPPADGTQAWEGIEDLYGEERTNYPITLSVDDLGEGFSLTAQVQRPVDPKRVCDYLQTALSELVAALETAPSTALRSLDILPEPERQRLLVEWNATEVVYPQERCIHQLFEEQAERTPDACAVVFEDRRLSYAELNAGANRLAHHLRSLGVGPEVLVGICVERSLEMVVGLLGILKAGGAYLPVDPGYPRERLAYMLEDAAPRVLLTQDALLNLLPEHPQVFCLDRDWSLVERWSSKNPTSLGTSQNLAYVIYTSGSTGKPKGVGVQHQGVLNLANWQRRTFGISGQSRISQFASYGFDAAVGETFMALLNGATLVMLARHAGLQQLTEDLNRYNITVAVFVPSLARHLNLDQLQSEELTLVLVGETCPASLASSISGRSYFANAYGPTEYTVYSHIWNGTKEECHNLLSIPVGSPIDNTKSFILDSDLNPVPVGVSGELFLTGPGIARGYLNSPGLTAQRFIPCHLVDTSIYLDRGNLIVGTTCKNILDFKKAYSSKHLHQEWSIRRSVYLSDSESVLDVVKDLDADLIEMTKSYIQEYKDDTHALDAFLRYLLEGLNDSYASCGINHDVLKAIVPFEDFSTLRGVDFGFGTGNVMQTLRELGAQVVGVDFNPFFVQQARNAGFDVRMVKVDTDAETFRNGSGLLMGSFDFAIASLLLDRVEDPKAFLTNLFQLLKGEGRFAIQTLLPVVGIDDGGYVDPIVYTPEHLRIGKGRCVEEDKAIVARMLSELGASSLNICAFPYVVYSCDGLQEYRLWSFFGKKSDVGNRVVIQATYSRMYRTGDLGRYRPDGTIEFLGRIDHQVKIRGFRIELGEIEARLLEHAGVREAIVLAREDSPGDKRLVAYLVAQDEQPSLDTLRAHLQGVLPDYMVPAAFVFLESLPLTPNGKVDRKALPAPDVSAQFVYQYVAPRNPTEEIFAKIWAEVLGVERVGVHDNFFEFGGDSILAIQVTSRARQSGIAITPRQLFEHQTIDTLARIAGNGSKALAEQGTISGEIPLTPIQCWFFSRNLPNPHHWNQSLLLEVRTPLDPELLEQALKYLVAHHDALRLRFTQRDGRWIQRHSDRENHLVFHQEDLSGSPTLELSQTIEAHAAQWQGRLNIAHGPIMRAVLFNLGRDRGTRLLLIIHHLVVDAVSWRVMVEDLQTAYQQVAQKVPIDLSPKTTSFKKWSESLREYAVTDVLRRDAEYWLSLPSDALEPLPIDNPSGSNLEKTTKTISTLLNSEDTRRLLRAAPKVYSTQIIDILLTALAQTVMAWSGSERVLIELEGHGREELIDDADLSRTVGWFTTSFPVLLDLSGTDTLGAMLISVTKHLRRVPKKGLPYGVARYLSRLDNVAGHPRAQVSFNYLGQFDQTMAESSLFSLAREAVESAYDENGPRAAELEVSAHIIDGQLGIVWSYSGSRHRRSTIEKLGDAYVQTMTKLIQHCSSLQPLQSEAPREETRRVTPSHKQMLPDWESEMLLDPAITPHSHSKVMRVARTACFVTGTTGFVGIFLLDELIRNTHAQIYCLVRASTPAEAMAKVQAQWAKYGLCHPFAAERIVPVCGDLALPLFGLSLSDFKALADRVDTIYHVGAATNLLQPYAALKQTNVSGTTQVLRLACTGRVKPLHYTSTLSVFSHNTDSGRNEITEDDIPVPNSDLTMGYAQTKFVAEHLVRSAGARGCPVVIYRLGTVTGDSCNGAWNMDDFHSRLLRTCIELGQVPESDYLIDMTPVDYVAESIVYASGKTASFGRTFHLNNPHPIHMEQFVTLLRELGYPVNQVSDDRWLRELAKDIDRSPNHMLYPFITYFQENRSASPIDASNRILRFSCRYTVAALSGGGITCPSINYELLSTYLAYLTSMTPRVTTLLE